MAQLPSFRRRLQPQFLGDAYGFREGVAEKRPPLVGHAQVVYTRQRGLAPHARLDFWRAGEKYNPNYSRIE